MTSARDILDSIAGGIAATREQVLRAATAAELIDALRAAVDELSRTILCDALGNRHETTAVDVLVDHLSDESPHVRSAAADALAKLKDMRAGEPLLRRLEFPEPSIGVRRMLVVALGAVDYRPAIPTLIEWLKCPDPSQRGGAAWSLGAMKAQEAVTPLKEALMREHHAYPKQQILDALYELRVARADPAKSRQ